MVQPATDIRAPPGASLASSRPELKLAGPKHFKRPGSPQAGHAFSTPIGRQDRAMPRAGGKISPSPERQNTQIRGLPPLTEYSLLPVSHSANSSVSSLRCFGGEGPHAAWFCMVVPGPEEEATAFTHRATVAFAMAPSLLLVFGPYSESKESLWFKSAPRVFRESSPHAPGPRALPD
jgi:hypothetical protein